jgi:hypothetical protein
MQPPAPGVQQRRVQVCLLGDWQNSSRFELNCECGALEHGAALVARIS